MVLSIVNRLTKTGHGYLNWPQKYCNENMVPHCKIIAHLKTFNVCYLKILTATPCFLYLFTQPTGKPIFLQKLPNRKCLFFKLIAPENGRNWPILHDVASLRVWDGDILRLWPPSFGAFTEVVIAYWLQKTILRFLYYMERYDKPNMGTDCDITPCPKRSNPYISVKNF